MRIFVSSPNDVAVERHRVRWIAERLNGEFQQRLEIKVVLWEDSIYNAHEGGFQPQIDRRDRPVDCDIVLGIFWGRLGTELDESFIPRRPDGTMYPSGTAYEILSALEARQTNGIRPDVFVFRKDAVVMVPISDLKAKEDAGNQWKRLQDFFEQNFELADKRILRAVERFREIGQFEQKVERLLRDWIQSHIPQDAVWSIEERGSPFRGLEPFDAKHAAVYFGRTRKVLRAIDELQSAARRGKPFLLIPGASGAGKSSLMRAGIAPRIVQPGSVPDVDLWRVAVMRPLTEKSLLDDRFRSPMLALTRALFVMGVENDDPGGFGKALPELSGGAFKTPERLAQLFSDAPNLAVDPIIEAIDCAARDEARRRQFDRPFRVNLLLLVDQLEEIFSESVTTEERALFARLLTMLVGTQRIWVVATLRGDMYEKVITDRAFMKLKDLGGQYDLSPPGEDEIEEILYRSATAAGLAYEQRPAPEDPSGLRHERLDDILLRDAAGENTLPLLQFALSLLFEKCWGQMKSKLLTISAYREIGGIDGAIDKTAESALTRLIRPRLEEITFPLNSAIRDEIESIVNKDLERLLMRLVSPVAKELDGCNAAGERALTSRMLPMDEVPKNDQTRRLIEILLQARILLSTRSLQGAWLRLSHDRVITSWVRARSMTEKNREFYRIRDSIENARLRWEESRRSTEYLIPSGAPVTQAEEKVAQFPSEFSPAVRNFVEISSRRARLRSRLTAAAAVIFAIVAVIASGTSWYATTQRTKAIENYSAARETVNRLVTSIAKELKDLDGIQVTTIETALNQVVSLVDGLERQNGDDPELKRIHASMRVEFASVFQKKHSLPRALEEAEKGLRIREGLATKSNAPVEWLSDLATNLDLVGDIHRAMGEEYIQSRDPRSAVELIECRKLFDKSLAIRLRLYKSDPNNAVLALHLPKSLVRIGDHKLKHEKDFPGAQQDYRSALEITKEQFVRDPENQNWEKELAWCLIKVGSAQLEEDPPSSLKLFEQALCTRLYLLRRKPEDAERKRDVAWALEWVGKAQELIGNQDGYEETLYKTLALRRKIVESDPNNTRLLGELRTTLGLISSFLKKQGHLVEAVGFARMANESQLIQQIAAEYHPGIDPEFASEQASKVESRMISGLQNHIFDSVYQWNDLKAVILSSIVVR